MNFKTTCITLYSVYNLLFSAAHFLFNLILDALHVYFSESSKVSSWSLMNRPEACCRLRSQRESSAAIWAVIRYFGNYAVSSAISIRPLIAATSTAPALALSRIPWSLVRWTAEASLLVLLSVILRSKQCLFHKLVINVDVRMKLDVAFFQLIWMLLVLKIPSKLLLMIKVVLELLIWLSEAFCTAVEVVIGIHLI